MRFSSHAIGAVLILALSACQTGEQQRTPTPEDGARLLSLLEATRDITRALLENQEAFAAAGDGPLTRENRETLMPLWAAMIDHHLAYSSYKRTFLTHWRYAENETAKRNSLVIGYAAHTARTYALLVLLKSTGERDNFLTALNEGDPDYGIAPGYFDIMLRQVVSPMSYLVLNAGQSALERKAKSLIEEAERIPGCGALLSKVEDKEMLKTADPDKLFAGLVGCALTFGERVNKQYQEHGPRLFERLVSRMFSNELDKIILPIQTEISIWLGDAKFRNSGEALISPTQIEVLLTSAADRDLLPDGALDDIPSETLSALPLQPGDVLVERRNWYLSNLGLPGFWPHAALYVGSPSELAATFDDDPDVKTWLAAEKTCDGTFTQCLARAMPDQWAEFNALDAEGDVHRVIEAVSDGVIFTSLEHSGHCDYMSITRPRIPQLEKAFAIYHAFEYIGRPYDFEFDFASESTLVCSEVVYRAYDLADDEGEGVQFNLSVVFGRYTLPPNDMIKQFDEEAETDTPQMDFVGFLDGDTDNDRATWGTKEALRASWRRSKWDLSQ